MDLVVKVFTLHFCQQNIKSLFFSFIKIFSKSEDMILIFEQTKQNMCNDNQDSTKIFEFFIQLVFDLFIFKLL